MSAYRLWFMRWLYVAAPLSVLTIGTFSCERKKPAQEAQAPAASTVPVQRTAYQPPRLPDEELHKLGMALEMRISSAYFAAAEAPDDASRQAQLGALYYIQGYPDLAARCFSRATELKSDERTWWYWLGLAYEKTNQPAAAIAAYERMIGAADSPYVPACIRLADLLLTQQNPARAEEICQKALAAQPLAAPAHYVAGRACLALGRPEQALEHFRQALYLWPLYPEAHRGAAEALSALGRTDEAQLHERKAQATGEPPLLDDPALSALLRNGLEPHTLCNDAIALAQRGQYEPAESLIELARQHRDAGTMPDEARAAILAIRKNFSEAAEAYRKVLDRNPQSVSARSGLAEVLTELGNFEEAEQLLRQVISENPTHSPTIERFATLMQRQNRPDEPIRLMQEAIAADPENLMLRLQLAQLLHQARRSPEAISELRFVLEQWPGHTPARHMLGLLLYRQGEYEAARAEWERELQLNPKYLDGYIALSSLARDLKNHAEVERIVREGLKHLPDSPVLANTLAWVLACSPDPNQRNPQEAVEWAEKACRITRHNEHMALDTLGVAYAAAGRFDEAIAATNRAIELAVRAGATDLAQQYRSRLALYRNRQPYYETE
jgi:tetratricopeptide (TPR) repeat protein